MFIICMVIFRNYYKERSFLALLYTRCANAFQAASKRGRLGQIAVEQARFEAYNFERITPCVLIGFLLC